MLLASNVLATAQPEIPSGDEPDRATGPADRRPYHHKHGDDTGPDLPVTAHDHRHDPRRLHRRKLAVVLALTTAALLVEIVGAVVSGSLALLADAGHALTDVAGLVLALLSTVFGRRLHPDVASPVLMSRQPSLSKARSQPL